MANVSRHVLSEEILDNIMRLFWERGYYNVSIEDLIQVTSFNRAALYKNFGGKHGLFVAMLYRFRNKVVSNATSHIVDPACGIDGIKDFFRQFAKNNLRDVSAHGCFMIATASNLPTHDAEVVTIVEEFINHLRGMFGKILRYMQAEHQLSTELDIEVTADYLVGNLTGLMTLFRASVDERMIDNYIAGVLNFLSSLPVRKETARGNLHLVN